MTRKAKARSAAESPPVAAEAPQEKTPRQDAPPAEATPTQRKPDFVWSGQPVFECHLGCGDRFQRIGDLAAVVDHERTAHPTNLHVTGILGPDGRPLIVRTD